MNFLALDTSSNACSVAVQVDDKVVSRHVVEARAHTRILMPMISELLEECGLAVTDLEAVILGNGPGSFIGMRIGASVAQGLCFGADLKIVPISSLAIVAAEALDHSAADEVIVLQDARMGEVYQGRFRRDGDVNLVSVGHEAIVTARGVQIPGGRVAIAGGGLEVCQDVKNMGQSDLLEISQIRYPNARYLLRLGAKAFSANQAVLPQQLSPAYLRTKVAEKPELPLR